MQLMTHAWTCTATGGYGCAQSALGQRRPEPAPAPRLGRTRALHHHHRGALLWARAVGKGRGVRVGRNLGGWHGGRGTVQPTAMVSSSNSKDGVKGKKEKKLYDSEHLPMFLASAPVFPNTHTQITSNPTDMIKLNAIVAGHRRFCIAWQDPNTRVISHVGCLVQVQNRRFSMCAPVDEYSASIPIRAECRLHILSAEEDPRVPFLLASVREWAADDEDQSERFSQRMSDGRAELALAYDILQSLHRLQELRQLACVMEHEEPYYGFAASAAASQSSCETLKWLDAPGVEWQVAAWTRAMVLVSEGEYANSDAARKWFRTFSYGVAALLPACSQLRQALLESATFSRMWEEADWLKEQVQLHDV